LQVFDSSEARVKFLRQHVTLTGLNSPGFDLAMENIQTIHAMFAKGISPFKLQPWTPGTFSGYATVEAHKRYFTSAKLAIHSDIVPFGPLIDPHGVLASVDQSRYFHTTADDVGYFSRLVTTDKKYK
jgi:hypothetical protein